MKKKRSQVKKITKRFPKPTYEFRCPNCGAAFVPAEEKHILKGSCTHFPTNLRVVFV